MSYIFYKPGYPLSGYIESFWIFRGKKVNKKEFILPNTVFEIVINLNSGSDVPCETSGRKNLALKRLAVSGLKEEPFTIFPPADYQLTGIRFRLGAAGHLFKIPLSEFTANVFEASDLNDKQLQNLFNMVLQVSESDKKIFEVMEKWLKINLDLSSHSKDKVIEFSLKKLADTENNIRIKVLADETGLSRKHLACIFKERIGLTPKSLLRIIKFQRILNDLENNQKDWASIVYQYGYHDQPHFIRDFKSLSGYSPEQYLRQKRNSPSHIEIL